MRNRHNYAYLPKSKWEFLATTCTACNFPVLLYKGKLTEPKS